MHPVEGHGERVPGDRFGQVLGDPGAHRRHQQLRREHRTHRDEVAVRLLVGEELRQLDADLRLLFQVQEDQMRLHLAQPAKLRVADLDERDADFSRENHVAARLGQKPDEQVAKGRVGGDQCGRKTLFHSLLLHEPEILDVGAAVPVARQLSARP
jgi:hypothetical protein